MSRRICGHTETVRVGGAGNEGSDDVQSRYVARLLSGFEAIFDVGTPSALHGGLECFCTAALIDPTRPEAFLGMAMCCMDLGDCERALRYFDLCVEKGFGRGGFVEVRYERDEGDNTVVFGIENDHLCLWRAACRLECGTPAAAARELDALSRYPTNDLLGEIALLRARIALADGDEIGARNFLAQALGFEKDLPAAHHLRGRLHERRGDPQAALRAYARAVESDGEDVDCRLSRARLRMQLGDVSGAAQDLDVAERVLDAQMPQPARRAELVRLRSRLACGSMSPEAARAHCDERSGGPHQR